MPLGKHQHCAMPNAKNRGRLLRKCKLGRPGALLRSRHPPFIFSEQGIDRLMPARAAAEVYTHGARVLGARRG